MDKITVIRARGKAILLPLIKVMKHFKISFGIVHDCDPPFKSNGTKNGMWTENKKIRDAIIDARESGITIRHRVSIPDFERFLGGEDESKDKPLNAYINITENAEQGLIVQKLLNDLIDGDEHDPISREALIANPDYLENLNITILKWAKENGKSENVRFTGVIPT
ncbi:hypothetical protein [Pseudomonas fragariae (ex Marin et al. 2024)]